jgi:Eukaryotic porin
MDKCSGDFCDKTKFQPQNPMPKTASTTTFFPPNFCRFPGAPMSSLNPGTISNLHKKVRDLTPEWIEGLNLLCAKNLDVNKTFYAEWMMGNNTPVGFRFGGMLCRKDNDSITVSNFV